MAVAGALLRRAARTVERRPLLAFAVSCLLPALTALVLLAAAHHPPPTWSGPPSSELSVRVRTFAAAAVEQRPAVYGRRTTELALARAGFTHRVDFDISGWHLLWTLNPQVLYFFNSCSCLCFPSCGCSCCCCACATFFIKAQTKQFRVSSVDLVDLFSSISFCLFVPFLALLLSLCCRQQRLLLSSKNLKKFDFVSNTISFIFSILYIISLQWFLLFL